MERSKNSKNAEKTCISFKKFTIVFVHKKFKKQPIIGW